MVIRPSISHQFVRFRGIDAEIASTSTHHGGHVGLLAEHAVKDVTAVQLADGYQVDRRDQQAHPTGEGNRVQHEVQPSGIGPLSQCDQVLHQQRLAQDELFSWCCRRDRHRMAPIKSEPEEDERRHQPGQRAADADVEDGLAVSSSRIHADHRAEGPDGRQRHGNEIGQRGVDAVPPGLDEVAHLVAEQDGHHRSGIHQPVDNRRPPGLWSADRQPRVRGAWSEQKTPATNVLTQVATKRSTGSQMRRTGGGGG